MSKGFNKLALPINQHITKSDSPEPRIGRDRLLFGLEFEKLVFDNTFKIL